MCCAFALGKAQEQAFGYWIGFKMEMNWQKPIHQEPLFLNHKKNNHLTIKPLSH
jgi:hypothetical protein